MPAPQVPEPQIFRVLPRQVDQTLSALLREWLPGKSWSQIRQLLKSRQIMINGNLSVDAGRRLKLEDVVKLLPRPAPAPPRPTDVRIVLLDRHVVVVEKPAGITSVRHAEERGWPARRRQIQPTLDEMLPQLIAAQTRRSGKATRGVAPPVRPVHRIDRDTSGLMIFARTIAAERHLGEQFRHHTTHRRYLAIALGKVRECTIDARLIRDRGDGRRGVIADPNLGKAAVTHVKPLEYAAGYTLVECRLETGRTHQIRIHMAHIGHPLCGEKVYHQPLHGKPLPDNSKAPRIALHAAELGFEHPETGEPMRFEMPLPHDLRQLWERLKSSNTARQSDDRRGTHS